MKSTGKEFTLSFTSKERYKKAVHRLMWNSPNYKLVVYGRYLYGSKYGYVTFKKIQE